MQALPAHARKLDLDRKTVRKYFRRGAEPPVYGPRLPRPMQVEAPRTVKWKYADPSRHIVTNQLLQATSLWQNDSWAHSKCAEQRRRSLNVTWKFVGLSIKTILRSSLLSNVDTVAVLRTVAVSASLVGAREAFTRQTQNRAKTVPNSTSNKG